MNIYIFIMGASMSTTVQDTTNTYITDSMQACPPASGGNTTSVSHVVYVQPPGCPPDGGFDIDQSTTVTVDCALDSLSKTAAVQASTLNANAQAGLGFSVATSVEDTQNNVMAYTEQKCAGASTTNNASVQDSIIRSCNFVVTQQATEQQACQIDALQDQLGVIADKQVSQAVGMKLGLIGLIIFIVIIIIILIAVAAFFLLRKPKTENDSDDSNSSPDIGDEGDDDGEATDQAGGCKKSKHSNLLIIVVGLVIVALLVSLLPKYCKKNKNTGRIIYTPDIQNMYNVAYPYQQYYNYPTYQYNNGYVYPT